MSKAIKSAHSSNRRIIVLRNSPDWRRSVDLWIKESRIDPDLFLPDPLPSGFPINTVDLIKFWNATFKTDFFSARQMIKILALEQFEYMQPDNIITQAEFESNPLQWIANSLLFFTDDDDFACRDLFERVQPFMTGNVQCVRWSSISVGRRLENRLVVNQAPRLRHWLHGQTILRPSKLGFIKLKFSLI